MTHKPRKATRKVILALLAIPFFSACAGPSAQIRPPETMAGATLAYEDGRYQKALAGFREFASKDNPDAKYYLAEMHANALVDETSKMDNGYRAPNMSEAVRLYREAASAGQPEAQLKLGNLYENGRHLEQNHEQAIEWYKRSAENGNAAAKAELGRMYLNGKGVDEDPERARSLFLESERAGVMEAQYYLGVIYESGQGVEPDIDEALSWYEKAEESGSGRAARARQELEQRTSGSEAEQNDEPNQDQSPDDELRKVSTGTGFYVNSNKVVTNAHVVDGCSRVTLGEETLASLAAVDEESDIAVLAVTSNRGSEHVVFRNGQGVRPGEEAIVVSYPLQGILTSEASVTTGNVSALAGPDDDRRLIQITAPVQSGSSGAPVLDSTGTAVGMVVGKLDAFSVARVIGDVPQNVNFALSAGVITSFLDANEIGYTRERRGEVRTAPEVAAEVKQYTTEVGCWD